MQKVPKGYKQEKDCTPEEVALIDEYYAESHPSNYPKDRSKAYWKFARIYSNSPLSAGFFAGYL